MPRRVAQPPIDRSKRELERREPWTGLGLGLVSLVVLFCGATHTTDVATESGGNASEVQLVKAFSSGGLHYSQPYALPAPSVLNDPTKAAAAFQRLQERDRKLDKIKYTVDVGAKTPCPT
jgi:hypothetical protein